jgi:hypothetical protein
MSLLQGTPPFVAGTLEELMNLHRHAPVPALRPTHPVPDGLQAWLDRLLQKVPNERYLAAADARAVLVELGSAESLRQEPAIHKNIAPALSDSTWFFDPGPSAPLQRGHDAQRPLVAASAPPLPDRPPVGPITPPLLQGAGASLFGLRMPRLVGRSLEKEALWSALKTVHEQGRVQAVILRGPAGVGRTRLGSWFVEKVRECGGGFVLVAGHRPGGNPAMALRDLLRPWLGVDGMDVAQVRRRLSELQVGGSLSIPRRSRRSCARLGTKTSRREVIPGSCVISPLFS